MVNAKAPVSIIDLTIEDPSSPEAEQPQPTIELPAALTPPASPPPLRRTRRTRPMPRTDRTERIRRRLFTTQVEDQLQELRGRIELIGDFVTDFASNIESQTRDLSQMIRAAEWTIDILTDENDDTNEYITFNEEDVIIQ